MTHPALTHKEHKQGNDWLLLRLRSPSRLITITDLRSNLPGFTALTDSEILALPDFPEPLNTSSGKGVVFWGSEILGWWRLSRHWRKEASQ